jgi:hypothetical protein
MQRKKTFLVVCISILTSPLWAQDAPPGVLKNGGLVVEAPAAKSFSLLKGAGAEKAGTMERVPVSVVSMANASTQYGSGSYLDNLGFFCKKEIQIENTVHIPLRLRLGSLQEVNRLEGKPGW